MLIRDLINHLTCIEERYANAKGTRPIKSVDVRVRDTSGAFNSELNFEILVEEPDRTGLVMIGTSTDGDEDEDDEEDWDEDDEEDWDEDDE